MSKGERVWRGREREWRGRGRTGRGVHVEKSGGEEGELARGGHGSYLPSQQREMIR